MQGMGKHSMEEVLERMDADLAACEVLLEDSGAYLTGTTPSQADCFLYGLHDHARSHSL
jgi:glutathione S-transferase